MTMKLTAVSLPEKPFHPLWGEFNQRNQRSTARKFLKGNLKILELETQQLFLQ